MGRQLCGVPFLFEQLPPGAPPGFSFMDVTKTSLRERFIEACGQLEQQLEPDVFAIWRKEEAAYIEATERGTIRTLSPLALAILATIWAHITDGEALDFPPELAAHYARAPKALFN